MSVGLILAPPPYKMVNAGSCDYKKKKKLQLENAAITSVAKTRKDKIRDVQ